jgi:PAS domain S-box-containing protein
MREWRLIDERSRAQEALRESEERFRVLFAAAPDAALIHDLTGRILDANRACEQLFGLTRRELLARSLNELGMLGDDAGARAARLESQRAGRATGPELFQVLYAAQELEVGSSNHGSVVPSPKRRDVELRTVPIQLQGQFVVMANVQDVSPRLEAEHARYRLEEQLHHAMKMDAIGRLAGGVAHDFNNMLTAISGYASLLLRREDPGSSWASGLSEILNASQRASGLTNQLLAFSRKQIIAPVVLDLNELLERGTRMIERLIGEHIALKFEPGADLCRVQVDPNQMEQVLINLAINARDAMPQGGTLRVRTHNRTLVEGQLPHIDARAEEYVVWSVEDDGGGMSHDTLEHLFEPFFTTKQLGHGTGLGLSIVYGVVKQNGGFIVVDSEPGRGSRFEIHLPRSHGLPCADERATRREGPFGHETILLVEDEQAVRQVAAQFLRNCGYDVVVATRGDEAIELVRDKRLALDLLVTDVVLPMLNGRQLFDELRSLRPELRVVFMSGYTDDVIARHGVLEPGVTFVEKPFSQETLARNVREALDRNRRAS